MIKEITLEELLEIDNRTNSEYFLTENRDIDGGLIRAQIIFKSNSRDKIYVGRKTLPRNVENLGIFVDDKGLPFEKNKIEEFEYSVYDRLFLGPVSFATAMAGLHREYIETACNYIFENNHPVYKTFLSEKRNVKKISENIKQAYLKSKYFEDDAGLNKFTKRELSIYKNRNKLVRECFKSWYINYINDIGFKDLAESEFPKAGIYFSKYVDKFLENLESKGFKKLISFKASLYDI